MGWCRVWPLACPRACSLPVLCVLCVVGWARRWAAVALARAMPGPVLVWTGLHLLVLGLRPWCGPWLGLLPGWGRAWRGCVVECGGLGVPGLSTSFLPYRGSPCLLLTYPWLPKGLAHPTSFLAYPGCLLAGYPGPAPGLVLARCCLVPTLPGAPPRDLSCTWELR